MSRFVGLAAFVLIIPLLAGAQEKSINPGINDNYQHPNVSESVQRFESNGRDVYDHRNEIVAALVLKPGMVVADVGAGTGLFTRLFSPVVGPTGKVYAVDIAKEFVDHIEKLAHEQKTENIVGVVCKQDSVELPPNSIDLVFICDVYHHFEFPQRTLRSIHTALKPGGQIVLIDYRRIKGVSTDWIMGHVRAGQEVFTQEIVDAGFKPVEEKKGLLKESYFLRFEKVDAKSAGPVEFKPGEVWPDNRGQHIQAHGGGIIRLGGTYYWFGEDRTRELDPSKRYVSCYSSDDLAHWTFRHDVVQQADPENFGRRWILERPKVFYCAKTGTYVMYMHIDGPSPGGGSGYDLARVGIATCQTVDGDYQYLRSFRPLGNQSRDLGQFIDDDGAAYLISEDRPNGFHIYKLSDDYLSIEKDVCLIREHMEGGAIVHYDGLYYVVGSGLTGWRPNPNKYATATKLEGPWSQFKDIAPPETNTYGSQSTMLLKFVGTKTTSVILMCDIWKPRTQWDSCYLWMPLEIGDGKLRLPAPRPWMLNLETGQAVLKDLEPAGVQANESSPKG